MGLCLIRPLAPGMYNVTVTMPGFANETATVIIPEDGSGVALDVYMSPGGDLFGNWGLARRFGPFKASTMEPNSKVRKAMPFATRQCVSSLYDDMDTCKVRGCEIASCFCNCRIARVCMCTF